MNKFGNQPLPNPQFSSNQFQPSIQCPKCHKDDKVSKVSAVTAGGSGLDTHTYYDTYAESYRTTTVNVVSMLAQKLSMPPKPEVKGGWGWNLYWLFTFPFWLYPLAGGCMLLALAAGSVTSQEYSGAGLAGLTGLGGVFLLALGALIFRALIRRYQRKKQQAETLRQAQQAEWDKLMALWKELFYCYRCDQVFNPHTRELVDPDQLLPYLSSRTGAAFSQSFIQF